MILGILDQSGNWWYSNRNNALHSVLLADVSVSAQSDPEYGKPVTVSRSMTVMVYFEGLADQAACKTAIQTIEAQLADDPKRVVMFHDINADDSDPSTASAHHLDTVQQGGLLRMGPPRLVGYRWGEARDAEYATRRTLQVTFTADYKAETIDTGTVIRYYESVSYAGFGGRLTAFSSPLTGYPTKVQLQLNTPRYAIQSGTALTWGAYYKGVPLWVSLIDEPQSSYTPGAIRKVNGIDSLYSSSWRYQYSGSPNHAIVSVWPRPLGV